MPFTIFGKVFGKKNLKDTSSKARAQDVRGTLSLPPNPHRLMEEQDIGVLVEDKGPQKGEGSERKILDTDKYYL